MNVYVEILLVLSYLILLYVSVFWLIYFIVNRHSLNNPKSGKIKSYPFVSIVIPAWNAEKTIVPTAESVFNLNYPKDKLELIIVNDGSTDNTRKIINKIIKENKDFTIRFIDKKENEGKAQGLNDALKILKGKYFACLDADSFVEKNTLKKMIYFFQETPGLSISTPVMLVNQPKTMIQKLQRLEYILSVFLAKLMGAFDLIYVAPGPFSVYKTDVIKKIGYFDTKSLTEDQEIAYRAQRNNYKISQCPEAYVYTNTPKNIRKLYNQRNRWIKGGLLNFFKHRKMLFNKSYGDFGMFQMPITISLYFLYTFSIFFVFYFLIRPILKWFHRLYLINFDLISYFSNLKFSFNILNVNVGVAFLSISYLIFSMLLLYYAHKTINQKIRDHNVLELILYFFIYYILISFTGVVVLLELLVGKRQKW